MNVLQILVLAAIQGLAELLPVSSSAHVVLAEKLMGFDPASPDMTFLLVMLHTGTMFSVICYFWPRWKRLLAPRGVIAQGGGGKAPVQHFLKMIILATACTGFLGLGLKVVIERVFLERLFGYPHGEIEHLFRNFPLIGGALFCVGILIILAGRFEKWARSTRLDAPSAIVIGIIQGIALPFRGFSRSGATISTALFCGIRRDLAEDFSFALAVALTPPVIVLELVRLMKASAASAAVATLLLPGMLGMVGSFLAGLVALAWLSSWLEKGRWQYFGYYCVVFSAVVFAASYLL